MKKKLHSCNVLAPGMETRCLWQYAVDGREVRLTSEGTLPGSGPLVAKNVARDWTRLWLLRLNIAWLPADQVFLRVIQLPACDFQELLSMLEFQLEKLSPLPLGQVVWSVDTLPSKLPNTQTVIVTIAPRDLIEGFLGKLEGDGFLADRLELPFLNQLIATKVEEDGAWIYPNVDGKTNLCLIAWWSDATLQNLQLLHLPAGDRSFDLLQEQLLNLAWAGEVEGWLRFPVRWHLVADEAVAAEWEPALNRLMAEPIKVIAPQPATQLAEISAARAARGDGKANLLPAEFAVRYHQQFIDRLWMKGLGALLTLYIIGTLFYFGGLQVIRFQQFRVDQQVRQMSGSYTNALQLKERIQVLEDQLTLRYAALDSWLVASELMPPELTLSSFAFGRAGNSQGLTLQGTAQQDQATKLIDYNDALRTAAVGDQILFNKVSAPNSTARGGSGGGLLTWTFQCELNRTEGD